MLGQWYMTTCAVSIHFLLIIIITYIKIKIIIRKICEITHFFLRNILKKKHVSYVS